jgi:uncharacterized cupredoxin-like copper-binding protein
MRSARAIWKVGAIALILGGCASSATNTESDITAVLTNESITLSQQSISSGTLSMAVRNDGNSVHEIEVFAGGKTDLPVANSVADTTGLTLVDEVEDILPGSTLGLDLDLEPGEYVIICNLPGHFQLGMVTKLTVTG